MTIFEVAGLLIAGHFMGDFGLQSDYLAKAKKVGPSAAWHLFGHSTIHGLFVGLATGSVFLGALETVAHIQIDAMKNRDEITFNQDQALHMICKLVWLVVWGLTTGAANG